MPSIATWPPPTLGEWKAQVRAKGTPRWVIEKLWPADGVVQVTGPPKTVKKTLTTMQLSLHVLSGESGPGITLGAGFAGQPQRVMFLEYEGPEAPMADMWDWLRDRSGLSVDENLLRWAHRYSGLNLTDPVQADKVIRLIKAEKHKVLVVDTMMRAAAAPENDAQAMNAVNSVFERLRSATDGGVVVYIHHLRKTYGSEDWFDDDIDMSARGSTALAGAYDMHLAFRPGFHQNSVHLMTRSKIDQERCFRLHWDIRDTEGLAGFTIEELPHDGIPEDDVLGVCADMLEGNQVHTLKQLAKVWDFPRPTVETVTAALCGAGVLSRTAKGFKKG